LTTAFRLALVVAGMMTVASAAGLMFGPRGLYAVDPALVPALVGQDALNLLIGVPLLVGSVWLATRGKLIGTLSLPGAFFYVIYDYGYYILGVPVNWFFLPYLALVALSAAGIVVALSRIDARAAAAVLRASIPARTTGGFLVGLAALFTLLWTALTIRSLLTLSPLGVARIVVTLDLTIQLPALALGGVLLWRRHEMGYVLAPGLLLQAATYLAGLSALSLLGFDATGAPPTPVSWVPGLIVGAVGLILLGSFVTPMGRSQLEPV
jgi:hypothetical protein